MANILCLETSTTNCSVAISVDGMVKAIREENNKKFSHAEKLHVFIADVLEESGLKMSDLDAVAVSKGPGSYTGLRIGVSAAKGLCFALDIPLISSPSLEVLAQQGQRDGYYTIPLLDARRMEVYSAVFNSKLEQIRETKAEILDTSSFLKYLDKGETIFLGDGAAKLKDLYAHKNAIFFEERFPSAASMALLAEAKFKVSDTEDVAYFEPFYLKEFMMG